jgi:hypothetical protein
LESAPQRQRSQERWLEPHRLKNPVARPASARIAISD